MGRDGRHMRSFLRVRSSSGDGTQYFAVAYELLGLNFFASSLEILVHEELYTTRGYLDYNKKVIIYSTYKNFGSDNREDVLNKFKSDGWFELSPGDPEIPNTTDHSY
jgi:hypothetical protein